jgi:hypothetical protein
MVHTHSWVANVFSRMWLKQVSWRAVRSGCGNRIRFAPFGAAISENCTKHGR